MLQTRRMDPHIVEIRRTHQPHSVCASCSKWVCYRCQTTWPCDTERAVRAAGVKPIGIYDYARLSDFV